MELLKKSPYFIIIALLAYVIFLRECNNPEPVEVIKRDTIITERVIKDTIQIKGKDIKVTDTLTFTDTIELTKLDTIRIVKSFLDTIIQESAYADSILTIDLTDTITRNKIIGRLLAYQFTKSDTLIKETKRIKRFKAFLGGFGGVGQKSINISPAIAIQSRNDNIYLVGTNILQDQPNFQAGALFKIRLRKK